MPDLLHPSGSANIGGRNYDYTRIYSPDEQGEEAKENARVWNVYLDEAESYDADMIQGFRNIIDGLLVFASIFSAVVTTFVVQTSQALQPDNMQIMASFLFENNQLLRAVGNCTGISAVPAATLGLGSRAYTSMDVWVNGLLFTSLALSLSTALLTVLVKQWIQAYTAIVPGGARTHALIRHFRFQGLMKWKLGDIIEVLPLILHGSVAIFLVGLAIHVSRLSSLICVIVSAITALTFLFYFGTSMVPAFDIACPYRIPFMFSLVQHLLFAFRTPQYAFLHLQHRLTCIQRRVQWPEMSIKSLNMAEHSEVFRNHDKVSQIGVADRLAYNSLGWVFNYSSNHSVKAIIVEGACGLLDKWSSIKYSRVRVFISSSKHSLFLSAVVYSLNQLPYILPTPTMDVENTACGRLIGNLMKIFHSRSLLDGTINLEGWQQQIADALTNAYREAIRRRYHALSRCLLDWGGPNLLRSGCILFCCASQGDAENIRDLVDRRMDLNHRDTPTSWTALHYAALRGNLDGVVALLEQAPGLIHVRARRHFYEPHSRLCTALDLAIEFGNSVVVAYLLDHNPNPLFDALHIAVQSSSIHQRSRRLTMIETLLDRGCSRTLADADGRTPIDIARNLARHDDVVELLEHYQTARLPPYPIAYGPAPQ